MNTASGALSFDAVIQNTDFKRSIDEIERRVRGMTSTVVSETNKIDDQFKRLGQLAAGYFTLNALGDFARQVVQVRGEFQQLEIAFNVLLRSKEKADALMAQAIDFAARTPFNLKDVATGAKQLLAYGSSARTVISELKTLGDVAAGTSQPIGDLVYLYGTLRSQGRAYAVDIRQFASRGIPIYEELSKVLKINVDQVNDFVSAGKVGFKEVEQAFKNMTTGNGLFAGTLDAQSKSVLGLISNLKDAYDVMLNNIGQANEGVIVSIIAGANTVVQHYEPIIDILKVLVATYGAYRAALIAASVVQAATAVAGNVQAWFQLAAGIRSAKDAQIAFNLASSVNPYVAAITIITALIATYAVYSREVTAAGRASEALADARQKANDGAAGEIAKIEVLKTTINDERLSREQRNKALKDLIALSPQHLQALSLDSIKTAEGTQAINNYINAKKRQLELQQIEADLAASIKREQDARAGKNDLGFFDKLSLAGASAAGEGSFDYDKAQAQQRKQINDQAVKDELEYQAKIKQRIGALNEAGKAGQAAEVKTQKAALRTVEFYDNQIKALKEEQAAQSTTRAQFDRYQAQIDAAEKARRRLTGELTAEEKRQQKAADKVGPYGSISYWENIAKKAQEIIDKTPSTSTGKLAQQNAIKLDAEQKAETIRKTLAVKSFQEEIEEKKRQYTQYEQWVQAYGQESADLQFAKLKASGQSYVDYLNTQIANLEDEKKNAGLTDKQTQNLSSLLTERDEATGKRQAIDVFRDSLMAAGRDAQNLTDYLTILKKAQADLDQSDNSTLGIQKRLEISQQINAVEADRKVQLAGFLVAVEGSEAQRYAITKKYADRRATLEDQYKAKQKDSAYLQANQDISKAENADLEEFQKRQAEASQAFKDLNKTVDAEGRKALQIRITYLKAYLVKLEETVGKESEIYKAASKELTKTTVSLDNGDIDTFQTFAQLAGGLGDALADANGQLGQTGRILATVATQAGLVVQAFKKGPDGKVDLTNAISVGIQGLTNLISSLVSASQQRKKAEEDYYRAVIGQQQEYNLLLNEQIRLRSQQNESVFINDYEGRLKDGVKALNDAETGYQAALKKLQAEGKGKSGLKTEIDGKSALELIGGAAATGAAIGAVGGVAGAAVGAVIGGIVGSITALFGGASKKVDEFNNLVALYPALIQKNADGTESLNQALAQTILNQGLVDDNTKQLLQSTLDWAKAVEEARDQIRDVIKSLAGSLGDDLRQSLVGAFEAGTDSAQAFGQSVSKILENLLSQLIFNQVFSKQFDQLQADLEASVSPGGDNSWIDDFGKFFGKADELTKLFNDGLQAASDAAKGYGLDVFGKNKDQANTSLTGAVKSVSQETASIIAGQMNAIRITQADTNQTIKLHLIELTQIRVNTGNAVRKLDELVDISDKSYRYLRDHL